MKTTFSPLAVVTFFLLVLHFTTAVRLACVNDSECRRNVCIDDTCQARRALTYGCKRDAHCFPPATCNSGTCGCPEGYGNCDGNDANGCEANLVSNDAYCGSCDSYCAYHSYCAVDHCECADGYGNCDGNYDALGCEVDFSNNEDYCGDCDTDCGVNTICFLGGCYCSFEFYNNCDETYDNGCEVYNIDNDDYCGDCDTVCGGTDGFESYCDGTSCACSEDVYYANCDGNYANGCEKYLFDNNDYCGDCDTVCGGSGSFTSYCNELSCACSEAVFYANCDGNYANGCEENLFDNNVHCGSCNHVCGGTGDSASYCGGTQCLCAISSYFNCDGNDANGCEDDDPCSPP